MGTESDLGIDQAKSVAFIITHTIKEGEEERYEPWLSDILSLVSRAPGYLGREVFRPAQGTRTYTSILRFDTWKQFLLVLSAIYPLTLIIPYLLNPLFGATGPFQFPLVKALIIAAVIVALMTYVIMPRYTRLPCLQSSSLPFISFPSMVLILIEIN